MALKLKFRTVFPAIVSALSPLTLVKTGMSYVFGIDVTALKASFGNILLGPISSKKGNIAYYTDTTGLQLGADLAFYSGNPGNSALFSELANPADGYLLPYNGLQISLGTRIGSGEQLGQGAAGVQQAIVGTVRPSATDTGNAFGVMGYALGTSAASNAVGTGGWGAVGVTNGNAWGGNFIVHNQMPVVANGGVATNWMSAVEMDINVWKGPAGAEMAHTNIFGLYIHGGGDSTTSQGQAIGIERLSVTTNARWATGVASRAGAAITAFLAGPATRAVNTVDSQFISLQALSGAGVTLTSRIWGDSGGDFIIQSPIGGSHILEDGSANIFLTAYNALGGSCVQLNKLSGLPGLAVIGATGVVNSTPSGAGVQTALGVAVGANGAFVTRGGDLGSPSAVGSLPAHTLAGTISGGGNQVNDVVVGAVSPRAGMFLAATANSLILNGTAGAGFLDIATQASGIVAPAAGFVRHGMDSSARVFYIRSNGKAYTFDDSGNTSTNRIYTLPDADGTVALESRLGSMSKAVTGVNFNSANTDTALAVVLPAGYTRFAVHRVVISNPSASLTTSTFGLFTTTGGGGAAIVASGTANIVSNTADNTANNSQAAPPVLAICMKASTLATPNTIYFRVQTPQGSAATADVTLYYQPLP